jgi:tyrosine-protein phosphatase non-receptor type 4
MVIQEKVHLIIAVCKLAEGGRPKCHKYWPEGASDVDPDFKNLVSTVRVKTLKEESLGANLIGRQFEILDHSTKEKHYVRQLHYVGWPDHDVPSGESIQDFSQMLEAFIMMVLNSKKEEKAVVHCSAGVGRTGTTCSLLHLMINTCA